MGGLDGLVEVLVMDVLVVDAPVVDVQVGDVLVEHMLFEDFVDVVLVVPVEALAFSK